MRFRELMDGLNELNSPEHWDSQVYFNNRGLLQKVEGVVVEITKLGEHKKMIIVLTEKGELGERRRDDPT